jgi:hypothetical protein
MKHIFFYVSSMKRFLLYLVKDSTDVRALNSSGSIVPLTDAYRAYPEATRQPSSCAQAGHPSNPCPLPHQAYVAHPCPMTYIAVAHARESLKPRMHAMIS